MSQDVRPACWSLYSGFQNAGWPHSGRRIPGFMSAGKHSVTFTALAALTKLESQPGQSGDCHESPSRGLEGLIPTRSPVLVVPVLPETVLDKLVFSSDRSDPTCSCVDKFGPGGGRACLTVVVCKDSGSRLRPRFCPLGNLPANGASQVFRAPVGKTLTSTSAPGCRGVRLVPRTMVCVAQKPRCWVCPCPGRLHSTVAKQNEAK